MRVLLLAACMMMTMSSQTDTPTVNTPLSEVMEVSSGSTLYVAQGAVAHIFPMVTAQDTPTVNLKSGSHLVINGTLQIGGARITPDPPN